MTLGPPYSTAYDPQRSAEGSIDPLGLQRTYERLAERILPFLTVRMSRPRFLTAMSVGSLVCTSFRDQLCSDGLSPPWLVFEWILLEAFDRMGRNAWLADPWGIPGVAKTRDALRKGRRLNYSTYLKSAKNFGFTGVYKSLATGLEILNDDLDLDEGGWQLLRAWEEEQDLPGFVSGSTGGGAQLRMELERAVGRALKKGQVSESSGWWCWETLAEHLDPAGARRGESNAIVERLLCDHLKQNPGDPEACAMREELLRALIDHGSPVSQEEEAGLFRGLAESSSAALAARLDLIDAYEGVCRPLDDGFRLLRFLSTERGQAPVSAAGFARDPLARELSLRIGPAVMRLASAIDTEPLKQDLSDLMDRFANVVDPESFYEAVILHHQEVQQGKLPDGKRPWVEPLRDGYVVRPQYAVTSRPEPSDAYLHWYRTGTACTFLQDLGKLPC